MYDVVLKNGLLNLHGNLIKADLAINGEKIVAIGEELEGVQTINVDGQWVFPGAIDVHTHFSLPFGKAISRDNFYTGSVAAAAGGVTSFIDFTAQEGDEGVIDSLKRRRAEADPDVVIDYSLHACINKLTDKVRKQIPMLRGEGVSSLKIFTAYNKIGRMQNDDNLLELMEMCSKYDILLTVHAENGLVIDLLTDRAVAAKKDGIEALNTTRPIFTEVEAIRRVADFAKFTGCKAHIVHISSGQGAIAFAEAASDGAPISGETCPQYLYLNNSLFKENNGHYYSCCPPIREPGESEILWEILGRNYIDVVATDHCPFNKSDKNMWNGSITTLPMGLPGVETMPELVLNGVHKGYLSLERATQLISENPARIFGMYPEKGSLEIGTDADIMVYDPNRVRAIHQKELHMNNDYSVYEGLEVLGKTTMTLLRGKVIFDEKKGFLGEKGSGRFIRRNEPDESFFG